MKFRCFAVILFTISVLGFAQQVSPDNDDEWYKGKPIRDIVFSGLNSIAQSEFEALIQSYRGLAFSDNIFLEIQGRLYALEFFDRIETAITRASADGGEVVIRFNVTEKPTVGKINFFGNSSLRARELSDVISSRVNEIVNQVKIRYDIEAIANKYREKGFPNVTVLAEEAPSGNGTVSLNFRINEQEKISISKIEFQGNSRFTSNALRSQLSLKAKSLINDGAFQEAKLITDREAIVEYYQNRGFINAVVRDVTRSYEENDKGNNLILTFMIEEGNEYRFGGIRFEGNQIFSTDQLNKIISQKTGEVVNKAKLEEDLQSVADLYFENGYIFNSIVRTPAIDDVANVLSYTISIIERNRAYIEKITIIGNEKTKTEVILREIPMQPGDVFSKTKVMDSMRNLYNLQYFSIVVPETLPGSADSLMELVFTVEEKMTTDVQLGFTFSGTSDPESFPISGLFEFTDRNLLGGGNQFGVKFNSSIVDNTALSINYVQNWLMGLPFSLGVDLTVDYSKRLAAMANQNWWFNGDESEAFPDGFDSYRSYIDNEKTPPLEYLMNFRQWYISLGFSSGYKWQTLFGVLGVGGSVRFGIIKNSYDDIFRPFDPVLRSGNNKWTPRNTLSLSTSIDKRDIYYDPSSGYYLLERMGFYGIFKGETEYYISNEIKAQYFLTLFDFPVSKRWNFKSVLALNFGLSFIFKQPGRGSDAGLPVIEESNKFAVDGMFVGRGWSDKYRYKGLALIDSWAELRFPIVKGILAFDMFFDAAGVETEAGHYFGKNSKGESNFTIDNMLFSFGGGLRITLPQFPIRISLAKKFHFENGDFKWAHGSIFGKKGLDLVVSFSMSY